MFWKLKAHTLALLSRMPAGRSCYHALQRLAGTNRPQTQRDLTRAFELVDLIHHANGHIEGSVCYEVGTGWRPIVPMVLALGGAKRVITVDVNPWMTKAYAIESWLSLEEYLPEIAARCGLPESEVSERYRKIPVEADSLNQFLAPLGIEYQYPADARETGLADNSIDLIVSSNVLEHIPLDVQEAIHQESLRILKPGGIAAHRFNPEDHFSTVDSNITTANFLQFSAKDWEWYGGSGLAYHNRMRARDYREMFERVGFEIEISRERIDDRALRAIQTGELKVHPEFHQYTPQELAVDYMWVSCCKPVSSAVNAEGAAVNV